MSRLPQADSSEGASIPGLKSSTSVFAGLDGDDGSYATSGYAVR